MRQSRATRHRGVAVRLTDRDRHLLEVLGRFRIARTRDLVRSCFPSVHAMTASMRMRRLFDAGFLAVHSSDPTQENVYQLGPNASDWKSGRVPRGNIAHHLAIVRAWSLLTAHLPQSLVLELARPDWELRADVLGHDVIPDLFLAFGSIALALEVDLGTEPMAVLHAKINAYGMRDRLFGYPFVLSFLTTRRIPGAHAWSTDDQVTSCYDLLLRQQESLAAK